MVYVYQCHLVKPDATEYGICFTFRARFRLAADVTVLNSQPELLIKDRRPQIALHYETYTISGNCSLANS